MQNTTTSSGSSRHGTTLSLAASYCVLYRELYPRESRGASVENTTQAAGDPHLHDDAVWQDDEWTATDLKQANETLQANAVRSKIGSLPNFRKNDKQQWNQFYTSHRTNFFQDRHYLAREFPEEFVSPLRSDCDGRVLVEIGCGVGNNILPLLKLRKRWKRIHAFDLSPIAIQLLRNEDRYEASNGLIEAHVWDITKPSPLVATSIDADVTCLLFCLSAIPPDRHEVALQNVVSTLRNGSGVLIFRDYGRYDEAQMKLAAQRQKEISSNFYIKHDGTKCYYFTVDELRDLTERCGLSVIELTYVRKIFHNRADRTSRRRVWIQGRFRRNQLL